MALYTNGEKKDWEQPIFTTKAHVFQIDPATKKKWLPVSSSAVNVSYYFDSGRNVYRIISVEGSKAVINSTVTANMTFTKTSQKFGQWSDQRANTVYGLGFVSEQELSKFVEKFKEVKEITRTSLSNGSSENGGGDDSPSHSSESASPATTPKSNVSQNSTPQSERRSNGTGPGSPLLPNGTSVSEGQLKYENDRLKLALAQSSANAKKWEVELQTLKNNNARLTTALQESTANVEEWKKQLALYKEESARFKKKCTEMEKGGGTSGNLHQVAELQDRVSLLERQINSKDEQISSLSRLTDQVKPLESKNQKLNDRVQTLERENSVLKSDAGDLRSELSMIKSSQTREKQHLRHLQETVAAKLTEINQLQESMAAALRT